MTAVDRERLVDLAAAATPGPWERGEVMGYLEDGGDVERTLWHSEVEPGICAGTTVEDAEFIAAAREAVPALLAENVRLRDTLARVEALDAEWEAETDEHTRYGHYGIAEGLRVAMAALRGALDGYQP